MESIIGKRIKITKIDAVNWKEGGHPTGIDVGFENIGTAVCDLKKGTSFIMEDDFLYTSKITAIFDELTFKTINSVYKIELI